MMTPLKQRILMLIRRAGPGGISGDDLFAIVYDGQLPRYHGGHKDYARTARTALKVHIYQLNKLIAQDGYLIRGSHCQGGWYQLQRADDGH
jgi:hypothetical protein